jgi:hypothetical protein
MVLLFCAATVSTRASPPCHAVRFFLYRERQNLGATGTLKLTDLSPALPSTVIYPSPESEVMKTIAALFFLATLPARGKLKSFRK